MPEFIEHSHAPEGEPERVVDSGGGYADAYEADDSCILENDNTQNLFDADGYPDEALDGPGLDRLVDEYRRISDALTPHLNRVESIIQAMDEDTKGRYRTHAEALYQTLGHAPDLGDDWTIDIAAALAAEDGDTRETIRQLANAVRPGLTEVSTLLAVSEPLSREAYPLVREHAVSTVDWQAVIARAAADHTAYADLKFVLVVINETPKPRRHGTRCYTDALKYLEDFATEAAVYGDTLPEGTVQEIPDGWQPNPALAEEVTAWRSLTVAAQRMISPQRRSELAKATGGIPLQNMHNLCWRVGLTPDNPRLTTVPPAVAYAMETYVEGVKTAYDKADDVVKDQLILEYPDAPAITGTALGEVHNPESPRQWLEHKMRFIPKWLVRGLGVVSVEHTLDNGKGAVYSPRNNAVHLSLVSKTGELRSPAQIARLLKHEMTHHGHSRILSLRWLRRWAAISKNYPVDVTPYVTQIRQNDEELGTHLVVAEDLASSATLYTYSPWGLYERSSERFHIWNELERLYSNDDLRRAAATLASGGTAKEADRILITASLSNRSYGAYRPWFAER